MDGGHWWAVDGVRKVQEGPGKLLIVGVRETDLKSANFWVSNPQIWTGVVTCHPKREIFLRCATNSCLNHVLQALA